MEKKRWVVWEGGMEGKHDCYLNSSATQKSKKRKLGHAGTSGLCCRLMLGRHPTANGHAGILPTGLLLLLLKVLVIGHLLLLFVGHVAGVHPGGARHIRLLGSIDIGVVYILGGLCWDLRSVNTILAGGGIGGVEAGLN